jgi:hypothetical protein
MYIFSLYLLWAVSFLAPETKPKCKVELEAISDSYDGECKKGMAEGIGTAIGEDTYVGEFKKGLPHGQGRYIWSDGNYYSGDFRKGMPEGYGEKVIKRPGQLDSLVMGYWKSGDFIGQYESAYNIGNNKNVRRVRIIKVSDSPNQIQIFVISNNGFPIPLESITGTDSKSTKNEFTVKYMGWKNVQFPFIDGRISYQFKKMDGVGIQDCFAEFEIFTPGSWEVYFETDMN